jgi:hypothetical protein
MKKFGNVLIGVSLVLGAVIMVSCSSDDDKEVVVTKKESKPLSLAEFNKIALGYGWVEAETHEILDNGKVDTKDFYEGRTGDKPKSYEFSHETATTFAYLENPGVNAFYNRELHYDETTGKVYFGNIERFTVLSADEKEMIVNKYYAVRENDKGYHKDVYHRVRLTKMSASELQDTKHKYWINGDDLERDLTPKDICHKWILQDFNGESWGTSKKIHEMRSSNKCYISFLPNGTIEGSCDGADFRGSYQLKNEMRHNALFLYGGEVQITPDENGGEWPNFFRNLPIVDYLNIEYGAYLNLSGECIGYTFIRATED